MTSLSVGTAITVVLSFLIVTFAYACPGMAFMRASSRYSYSTTAHHIKTNPCQGAKKDICQSVRDRMLSVRATSLQFLVVSPDFAGFPFLWAAPRLQSGQTFHPERMLLFYLKSSKPPFPLYTTVLRI
jgi:hypothetical protein